MRSPPRRSPSSRVVLVVAGVLAGLSGLVLVATCMTGSVNCSGLFGGVLSQSGAVSGGLSRSDPTATVVAAATNIELTLLALQARTPTGTPTVLATRTATPTTRPVATALSVSSPAALPAASPTLPAAPVAQGRPLPSPTASPPVAPSEPPPGDMSEPAPPPSEGLSEGESPVTELERAARRFVAVSEQVLAGDATEAQLQARRAELEQAALRHAAASGWEPPD